MAQGYACGCNVGSNKRATGCSRFSRTVHDAACTARFYWLLLLTVQQHGTKALAQEAGMDCSADDPLWWEDDEVALLKGTRLEIAVQEHRKIVQKLALWRDRLVDMERYRTVPPVADNRQKHLCGSLFKFNVRSYQYGKFCTDLHLFADLQCCC